MRKKRKEKGMEKKNQKIKNLYEVEKIKILYKVEKIKYIYNVMTM